MSEAEKPTATTLTGEEVAKLETALMAELKEALESWPLYRKIQYDNLEKVTDLPPNLNLYCPKCQHVERWTRDIYRKSPRSAISTTIHHKIGFGTVQYRCCNCPSNPSYVNYYFYWGKWGADESAFFKAGQWPAPDEGVSSALQERLDEDDLDFYKKAIRLRNHSLGLGALAYLRRVVENRINDMLDVLAEAAREHHFAAIELAKIETVKASHRFDDKIDYAAKLLPSHLRPEGKPNPIDKLHELTSDGLHARSEEECIEIFDKIKNVFEYVFGALRVHVDDARLFVKSLEELQPRTKKEDKKM
jgi:hypothetical protein